MRRERVKPFSIKLISAVRPVENCNFLTPSYIPHLYFYAATIIRTRNYRAANQI